MKGGWSKKLESWAKKPADKLDAAALALVADSQAAARLRGYQNDPSVAALGIERTRDRLDVWGWLLIFAGLAFTTVNVQKLIAGGAPEWSVAWLVAWTVEPMVMGLMLVLLRGEQIANRHGEQAGGWVRFTRWASLLITYVMNTLESWLSKDPKQILIHSVPVVMVFLASEALVQQRLTLTTVVDKIGRSPEPGRHSTRVEQRWSDLDPTGPAEAVESAETPPQLDAKAHTPVRPVPTPSDEVSSARTLKERAWAGFRELAQECVAEGRSLDEIGPAEVDRRAGLEGRKVAKVSGRMAEFRERWMKECEGGEVDGEAAV